MVPRRGVIVEIGTAQGGSSFIFHAAAGHRGVRIYSFDIAPSAEAYEHLKHTNVSIVAKPSTEGASLWTEMVGDPIDLLFIDGSHALQHVFEDFVSWAPFLKPGGEVVFHDYDSGERGGIVHFGVYVFLKTILRLGVLERPLHQDRLLYGTLNSPSKLKLLPKDCLETLIDLGQSLVHLRNADYNGWMIVGEERFGQLLRGCLKMDHTIVYNPNQVTPLRQNLLVFARPLAPALATLREKDIPKGTVVTIDNLQACYLVAHGLERNRNYFLNLTSSRKELFRWEEQLFMLEHALRQSYFPERMQDYPESPDIISLSRLVAAEQVRLTFLSRILETFVDWRP
jgi:hypothetical protein